MAAEPVYDACAPVSAETAVAWEPVYDACAPFSAAVAEAVLRGPVSAQLSAAEPVSREPLSAAEPVWQVQLSAAEPVWLEPLSDPGHTADSASGSGLAAVAAERRTPLRH